MKDKKEEKFNFTWGLAQQLINDLGFVQVTGFMLDAYTELGLTRNEFLCIIHLAQFHYNIPEGESRPGAPRIAKAMGYSHPNSVRNLIKSLEKKGMLLVTRQEGKPSIYDATPFAHAAFELYKQRNPALAAPSHPSVRVPSHPSVRVPSHSNVRVPSHSNVTEENELRKGRKKRGASPSFRQIEVEI